LGRIALIVWDARVADFVGYTIGVTFSPPLTCIGIEHKGAIVGGAVFNVFEGADIHISVAGTKATKGFLSEVGHYVYTVLGCERMTIITEQTEIVGLAEKLGGQVEGLMRSHFGAGRDAFIVGILKHEYRF
jgi:hypothetical protein